MIYKYYLSLGNLGICKTSATNDQHHDALSEVVHGYSFLNKARYKKTHNDEEAGELAFFG